MPHILQRYATPLITGLFIVSLVSGVALFFHIGSSYFHSMHEWLSIVLILPFALHLWKNWRAMVMYFKKPAFAAALVLSLALATAFIVPAVGNSSTGGRPPVFELSNRVMQGTVSEIAAVFDITAEALAGKLNAAGYTVQSTDQTLSEIATLADKSSMDLARVLIARDS